MRKLFLYLCILREITLDIRGCCEECIYVNPDEKALDIQRKELLKKYDD